MKFSVKDSSVNVTNSLTSTINIYSPYKAFGSNMQTDPDSIQK